MIRIGIIEFDREADLTDVEQAINAAQRKAEPNTLKITWLALGATGRTRGIIEWQEPETER